MLHLYTIYTPDWGKLADVTLPIWEEYAKKHGYQLHHHVEAWDDHKKHYSFTKSQRVFDYMMKTPKYDHIFVFDLDMLPTNLNIEIEDGWRPYDDKHITLTSDINGLNSGAYIIRQGDVCRYWLSTICALHKVTTSEQHAMWELEEMYRPVTKYLPHPTINSIPYDLYPDYGKKTIEQGQWEPGQLLMHLPGMSMEKRLETFKNVLPHIEK